jgi:hypothetical protein
MSHAPRQFVSEYQQEFADDYNAMVLAGLAMQYHLRTEEYDQVICSGRTPEGVEIPANTRERLHIDRFAKTVFDVLYVVAESIGYTRLEFHRAVFRAARHFQQAWQRSQNGQNLLREKEFQSGEGPGHRASEHHH